MRATNMQNSTDTIATLKLNDVTLDLNVIFDVTESETEIVAFEIVARDCDNKEFKSARYETISRALDELHRFACAEFAQSIYVIDDELNKYL
jgi:hypothetical protein